MSDLPFKFPVKLPVRYDPQGGFYDADGRFLSDRQVRDALNRLPLLLSIAEAAKALLDNSYHRAADTHIEVTFQDIEALDTALSAWREGKGKDNG